MVQLVKQGVQLLARHLEKMEQPDSDPEKKAHNGKKHRKACAVDQVGGTGARPASKKGT